MKSFQLSLDLLLVPADASTAHVQSRSKMALDNISNIPFVYF